MLDNLCEIKSLIKYLLLLELSMRNNRSKGKHIIIVKTGKQNAIA